MLGVGSLFYLLYANFMCYGSEAIKEEEICHWGADLKEN